MTDLDTMYEQVKEYEAKIQAAGGEKAALGRQLEQHEADLEKEEQECMEIFGCSLGDLDNKYTELSEKIQIGFKELKEKIESLE